MNISVLFLVIAVVLFAIGSSTRLWRDPATYPYFYQPFLMGGLFFWSLSALWPQIAK